MIEMFDLEWRLDEMLRYAAWFAGPARGTDDDRIAFDGLVSELRRPEWTGRAKDREGSCVDDPSRSFTIRCASGSRWRKASRLAVDSPRDRRQTHSRRMLSANPSSKIALKLASAVSATTPRIRSTSAWSSRSSPTRPVR